MIANVSEKVQEGFALLVDSILALQRENKEVLWGSMVKETMKRKKPSFNETYYGFRTFSHLLEDAQRRGIVVLRRDQKSGSYIVEDLGSARQRDGPPRTPRAGRPAGVRAFGRGRAPRAAATNGTRSRPADGGGRGQRRAYAPAPPQPRRPQPDPRGLHGHGRLPRERIRAPTKDRISTTRTTIRTTRRPRRRRPGGSHDGVDHEPEPEHASLASPEPEPAPGTRNENDPEHAPERSFSLFSWIRRPPTE